MTLILRSSCDVKEAFILSDRTLITFLSLWALINFLKTFSLKNLKASLITTAELTMNYTRNSPRIIQPESTLALEVYVKSVNAKKKFIAIRVMNSLVNSSRFIQFRL